MSAPLLRTLKAASTYTRSHHICLANHLNFHDTFNGSMESLLSAHAPAFRKALDDFQFSLAQNDRDLFKYTTLADLQRSILEIQSKHASERKMKNMARLNSFLEAMEQYGKVIEVFLNASEFVAFVWVSVYFPMHKDKLIRVLQGPAKFLLQVVGVHLR